MELDNLCVLLATLLVGALVLAITLLLILLVILLNKSINTQPGQSVWSIFRSSVVPFNQLNSILTTLFGFLYFQGPVPWPHPLPPTLAAIPITPLDLLAIQFWVQKVFIRPTPLRKIFLKLNHIEKISKSKIWKSSFAPHPFANFFGIFNTLQYLQIFIRPTPLRKFFPCDS
jgi:hypothetical protein